MVEVFKIGGVTLKKVWKSLFFIFVLLFTIAIFFNIFDLTDHKNQSDIVMDNKAENKGIMVKREQEKQSIPTKGVYTYIGKSSQDIKNILGKPDRIDQSSYDYVWWIYNSTQSKYLQIGILGNKAVTAYVVGQSVNTTPFKIGSPINDVYKYASIDNTVSLKVDGNSYRFELSEDDLNIRPLIKIGKVYIQLYFDKFNQTLSSIRYMDGESLVKQRPYELVFRGDILSSEDLTKDEWKKAEAGNAQEILDITNVIRERYKLGTVKWDDKTAKVAYDHSKDMYDEKYFSHDSPKFGGLADRLAAGDIFYKVAGENIAAKYVDGIAAVAGWLNSEDHRKTLLNKDFTHLGVGVYEKYYTQNFIETWDEQ